ncbi:restriction endonuclease subunit S [Pectobacterium brasiliense]|uniref:restriction endonuclease subunit S n=1 Tax=Pectobacterium brasiliense TaxID=180957 RepID=UPI0032F0384F
MNKQKKDLVPELRFPEFKEEMLWTKLKIGKHLKESRIKGSTGDRAKKLTVKLWGNGVYAKDKGLKGSENTQYYLRSSGQFIYSKLDFLNQAFGVVPEYLNGYESTVDLPCFDVSNELDVRFLLEYIQRKDFYKKFGEIADGGRKAKRIQVETFLGFPILIPKIEEQQKIADCLASIDELITLHTQKLEALGDHKKGLIQQVFPAEGETVPKLRFPGFRAKGAWIIYPFGSVGENLDSKRVPITEKERVKGNVPYYGASGVIDYVNDYIFDEQLLCVSEDGANLRARTYPIAFSITGKTWVNNHAHVIRFEHKSTQTLVENYLNSVSLEDYLTGMAQPKLNRAKLDIIPIPLPSIEEQDVIADLLNSLDELVIHQASTVENLAKYKNGLVQKLFPVMDEVN